MDWKLGGYLLFFFFSSRRRHTRFDCDWSSDVCSSDLCGEVFAVARPLDEEELLHRIECRRPSERQRVTIPAGKVRSEEHTSELQSQSNLVCRLLLEKKKKTINT